MLKIFALFALISFTFSLKDTVYTYKAMTELKKKVDENVCLFIDENNIYVKACQKGYTCVEQDETISLCEEKTLKKLGEKCNSDDDCMEGHCDNVCTFTEEDEPVYIELEGIYTCGKGLIYSKDEKKCKSSEKFTYLKDYCKYTPKGESKQIDIEPAEPFYMCGEIGVANEKDQKELEEESEFVKANRIGKLDNGVVSDHEYACKTGYRSIVNDSLICDDIIKINRKGKNEEGFDYAEFVFEKMGVQNITIQDFDGLFFYINELTGEYEPYGKEYIDAFKKYVAALDKYKDKCKKGSHDYYFNPLHCGVKEIYDAYFYLNHMALYGNNTKEANMIKDFFKMMEFNGDKTDSSNFIFLKKIFLVLTAIFILF